jgi:hypothetical protein
MRNRLALFVGHEHPLFADSALGFSEPGDYAAVGFEFVPFDFLGLFWLVPG